MKTALVFCIVAALGYGVGAVLQALGARHAAHKGVEGIAAMVKQPMFLLGLLADLGSWLISRFALHTLPLFAVQSILAGSLAVTVVLARVVLGADLRRPDQIAIAMTMVGLLIVGISAGEDEAKDVTHLLKICILLGIPATIALGLFALKLNKSVVLAVLAGGAFTSSALAARAVHVRGEAFADIVTEPLIWAVLAYALLALALHAVALMRGSVGPVTAAMWSTEVLVATIIGAIALGDHMRDGWVAPAIVGISLTLGATLILARSPAQELEHRAISMTDTPAPLEHSATGLTEIEAMVQTCGMTLEMTTSLAGDAEASRVSDALDALLAAHDPINEGHQEFRGHQYDAGLAWVHFPTGFGGLGVRPVLQKLVEQRLRAAGARPADAASFFLALAGPTIVTHGTDEQQRRFLRPMFTGEQRWCQLFSEPGAGSDFAGLATRAVRDGDEWIVNGQKVWNTIAHLADWGMLVTRSNPDVPKHKGMTYFALDMHSPGVEVRPLRQITGEAEFNEVYLTDVRIPDANRVGAEGEGWRVSLTTLMNERSAIGGSGGTTPKRGSGGIGDAVQIWQSLPADRRNPAHKDRLMRMWVRVECLRLTNIRAGANRTTGNPGPEASVSKLALAELNKELFELCVDLLGPDGQVGYDFTFRRPETLSTEGSEHGVRHAFLRVRANSIEGGTSEIMRNILGEQVLGLPGEPRVDKDVPWASVPRS